MEKFIIEIEVAPSENPAVLLKCGTTQEIIGIPESTAIKLTKAIHRIIQNKKQSIRLGKE